MKRAPLQRKSELRASLKTTRKPVSPASTEQRVKCRDRICVNCGNAGCDPAHLTPRSQGGCDSADCVIPLCRTCHDMLDGRLNGGLDLEPVLALRQFAEERSHMALHLSLEQCRRRLRGGS